MGTYQVSKDGFRDFRTVQEAIQNASPGDTILIGKGIYEEKIELLKDGLRIIGEDPERCIIRWSDYALKAHEDGQAYGTFRSYTCLVQGNGVRVENLTIENAAGDGRNVGQAIALYADGDRLSFINCQLIGYQDTIFTAPLPESPRIPGSFIGPSEHRPYQRQRQYFQRCSITGDVDYIFGSALVVFHGCTMRTRDRGLEVNGYVTAPSTWEEAPYGYVFLNCNFLGEKGIKSGSVFLGRPWRPYGQVKLVACLMDESIHKNIWDPWGNLENLTTAKFERRASDEMAYLDQWHKDQLMMKDKN